MAFEQITQGRVTHGKAARTATNGLVMDIAQRACVICTHYDFFFSSQLKTVVKRITYITDRLSSGWIRDNQRPVYHSFLLVRKLSINLSTTETKSILCLNYKGKLRKTVCLEIITIKLCPLCLSILSLFGNLLAGEI